MPTPPQPPAKPSPSQPAGAGASAAALPSASSDGLSPTPSGGWSGRFAEPVSEIVKRYTASVGFDHRLAEADIDGSLAHARMLAATGILTAADLATSSVGWQRSARRSLTGHLPGRSTRRTSTSISKSA